jgi:hypothetical protein
VAASGAEVAGDAASPHDDTPADDVPVDDGVPLDDEADDAVPADVAAGPAQPPIKNAVVIAAAARRDVASMTVAFLSGLSGRGS